ncbi:hypothetical protein I352_01616 [Cryptococcus deuterogattii MMRL2647]|nr:hypothetical protein I352_01616 [Cryptococcus deuterogattii MMRL2647]
MFGRNSAFRNHLAEDEEERSQEDSEDESDSDKPIELDGEEERIWQGMIYSRALAPDGTDDSWGGDSLAVEEDESDDEDVKPKDKRKGKRTSAMSIVSRRESAGSGAGGEKDGGKWGKQTRAQEESEEDSPSPVKRKGARESSGADVRLALKATFELFTLMKSKKVFSDRDSNPGRPRHIGS